MSGYSFYGGKEGRTYNLVAHYDSVADMTTLFSQGGSYTDVNYNEYVIIDTIINDNNKTSPENGLLYRRGLNYTEEVKTAPNINAAKYYETKTVIVDQETTTIEEFKQEVYEADFKNYIKAPGGGAIYVGQIVGPTGDSPSIELLNWNDFINKASDDEITVLEKTDFIPNRPSGKEQNHAQYGYCNIADSNGNIIGAYLSFDFPYTVFEVSAESVSPYGVFKDVEELPEDPTEGVYYRYNGGIYYWNSEIQNYQTVISVEELPENPIQGAYYFYEGIIYSWVEILNPVNEEPEIKWYIVPGFYNAYYNNGTWSYNNLISEKEDSIGNVYYYSHDIKIPTGIKGDDITDLSIIMPSEKNQWLAYKDRNYNTSAEGTESDWKLLAPYKVISNVSTNKKEGYKYPNELQIDYTHGESDIFKLRNIERLEMPLEQDASNRSHLLVHYTDEEVDDLGPISYVKSLTMGNKNGENSHTIYYELSTDNEIQSSNILGYIRHIVGIRRDESGKYWVTYATGNEEEEPKELGTIRGIKKVEYDKGQFKFTWDYQEEGSDKTDTFTLKVLNEIEVADSYNADIADTTEYDQVKDKIPNELKRRVITAKYEQNDIFNNEELYQINEISDIKLQGDNIVVLYSDPEKRKNINESQVVYRDGYRWENLGPILNGNHIQGHFSSLVELRENYPYGFGKKKINDEIVDDDFTKNRQGWIATVTNEPVIRVVPNLETIENPQENIYYCIEEGDIKTYYLYSIENQEFIEAIPFSPSIQLYAYDYNLNENNQPKGWYLIQELGAESVKPEYTMILETPDSKNLPSKNEALLNNNGFWFVLENKE